MGLGRGVAWLFSDRSCEKASLGEEEAAIPPSAYLLTIDPTLFVDLVYLVFNTEKPGIKLVT